MTAIFAELLGGLGGSSLFVKILAIVGAAALGGFLAGWLAQIIARQTAKQAVPGWPLWIVRGLGAVACGWVVGIWLFGTGGDGLGGPGGGLGSKDKGKEKGKTVASKERDKEKGKKNDKKGDIPKPTVDSIVVEVLGDGPLKKLKGDSFDRERRYRVNTPGKTELQSLEETQKLITQRLETDKSPLHKLTIVVYLDAPDRARQEKKDPLWLWALDRKNDKFKVEYSLPDTNAPVD